MSFFYKCILQCSTSFYYYFSFSIVKLFFKHYYKTNTFYFSNPIIVNNTYTKLYKCILVNNEKQLSLLLNVLIFNRFIKV